MLILAGDIGGTKTHLAFFEKQGKEMILKTQKKFHSHDYPGLASVVEIFLLETGLCASKACFGVAGAVSHGVCHATNLPWEIKIEKLAKSCKIKKESVAIINDLEANAWGIKALKEKDFSVLNQGKINPRGNQVLISAGTGLGEAGMVFIEGQHYPFASEGGHADFASRDEEEDALLKYLRKRWGHVSYERILSGPGIANVHSFLIEDQKMRENPLVLDEIKKEDKALVISRWGFEKKSSVCEKTLTLFSSIYASAAGNLALKMVSTGGVFIGGGIAPKILPFMQTSLFLKSFRAKGRFEPLLKDIPIKIILREDTALLGAMVFAKDRIPIKNSH